MTDAPPQARADRPLMACPQCDLLYYEPDVALNETASCLRCGEVLAAPRTGAYARVLALAVTAVILMVAAIYFPFIEIAASGLHNRISVLDSILAFSTGLMVPLSVALAFSIVLLPTARLLAIIYTLWPLMRRQPPYRHAARAFRMAQTLRPWSMAEIFIVGVSVALVKVAGLATVSFGPAFWALAGLVIVNVLQDNAMCRFTIWKSLEPKSE